MSISKRIEAPPFKQDIFPGFECTTPASIPPTTVTETIQFTRADLEYAWQAIHKGPHHGAVAALTLKQAETFRAAYTRPLTALLSSNEDQVLNAEVIYAFGRKPHPFR
jgi:hypothetical protein